MSFATTASNYTVRVKCQTLRYRRAFASEETLFDSINHAKSFMINDNGIMEIDTVFFAPYFGTPVTKNSEHDGIRIDSFRNDHTAITMRGAVTGSEKLTVNEIARTKEIFKRKMIEHYIAEALRTTKDELSAHFRLSPDEQKFPLQNIQ